MNSNRHLDFLKFFIEVILLGFVLSVLANRYPISTQINTIILLAIALLLTITLYYLQVVRPPNGPTNWMILAVIAFFLVILFGSLILPTPPPICLTLTNVKNSIITGKPSLTEKDTPNEKDREQKIYDNNKDLNENNSYLLALAIPAKTQPQAAKAMLAGVADAQTKFNNQLLPSLLKPTISQKKLKIVVVDDRNNKDNFAKEVACEIATNPDWKNILGVIGHHSSGASKAALDIYNKADLTMITPTSTSTELNQNSGKEVFFRTTVNNKAFAKILAQKIISLGKVRVFYEGNNDYAEDLKKNFIEEYNSLAPNPVKEEEIIDIQNLNSQTINKLTIPPEVKAAVIFSSSGDDQKHEIAIKLIKKLKSTTPKLELFGGDSLYKGKTLSEGKTSIEGLKLVIPWHPVNSNGQMISAYAKESASTWGGLTNWMTASSYDATQAFLAAIAQVEKKFQKVDKKSVLESMRTVDLKEEYTSGETLKFENSEPQGRKPPIFVEVVQQEKLPKLLQCGVKFEVCFKPIQ